MSDFDPRYLEHLTAEERAELEEHAKPDVWAPHPDNQPQIDAFNSEADIIGFGGAAGGGKSDLACGLATTQHQRVGIFKQTGTELTPIVDRIAAILGTRKGLRSQPPIMWRFNRRSDGKEVLIEFGSLHNLGDEEKQRGHDRDLIVFDEASNMREAQVRFVIGWLRSVDPNQRKRVLLTFNPPGTAEGRWVIDFFGPWLDDLHPNPAEPGELRWFATVNGKDMEVDGPEPFVLVRNPDRPDDLPEIVYEFDSDDFAKDEVIRPLSRTFIPSRIEDNPYLLNTAYMQVLQGLPEPMRSQMLRGDFRAGMEDDPMQVIPTSWVDAAMARWKEPDQKLPPMDSIGVDVAMGGKDNTVISRRHGMWFNKLITHPGRVCVDGATIGGFIIQATRDAAPIHIDLFGVGAQPYGHLNRLQLQVYGVNFGEPAVGSDVTGRLTFVNLRSYWWWMMREALDPMANNWIALPNDKRLRADLCAPRWMMRGRHVFVEGRDELIKRIGRSPDFGTATILALMDTPKWDGEIDIAGNPVVGSYDRNEFNPLDNLQW